MNKQIVHSLATVTSDGQDIIFGHTRTVSQSVCCLSVCLSVRPSVRQTSRLPLGGFSCNLIFENFSKVCRENSSFIKI